MDKRSSLRLNPLSVNLTAGEPSIEHEGFEIATEAWVPWLQIGLDHLGAAKRARAELEAAFAEGDQPAKFEALGAETRAGLVAVATAAFAVDAFYAATLERVIVPPETQAAWKKNRTARPAHVVEVLKLAYAVKGGVMSDLARGVRDVYRFRDWAVHPPAGFRPVRLHPVLKEGVEWRTVAFSSDNAYIAVGIAEALITACLENPRSDDPELVKWATSARRLVPERRHNGSVER